MSCRWKFSRFLVTIRRAATVIYVDLTQPRMRRDLVDAEIRGGLFDLPACADEHDRVSQRALHDRRGRRIRDQLAGPIGSKTAGFTRVLAAFRRPSSSKPAARTSTESLNPRGRGRKPGAFHLSNIWPRGT